MRPEPDGGDDRRGRALAAAAIASLALERELAHMALAGATEAARSALLALGGAGRAARDLDLDLLRTVAAAAPHRLAGDPSGRADLIRAALAAVHRLLPTPRD